MAASEKDVLSYLDWNGPLVDVFLACRRGAIGPAVAEAAVAQRNVVESVTAAEMTHVSDRCVRWGYRGNWQDAMLLHSLLMACCLADPHRFAAVMGRIVPEHLRVATSALWNRPDNAIYTRARGIGEQAWSAAPDKDLRNVIAFEMGILHLDPYAASRTSVDLKRWWAPMAQADSADASGTGMPEPAKALELARQWLERSLEGSVDVERLQSLKALIQLAMSLPLAGVDADTQLARKLLPEALMLAAHASDRTDITAFLASTAEALGVRVPEESDAFRDSHLIDWQHRAEAIGIDLVADDILALLRSRKHEDRAQALAFARRVKPIIEQAGEASRLAFHGLVIQLLLGPPRKRPWISSGVQSALRKIKAAAHDGARAQRIEEVFGWVSGLVADEDEAEAGNLLVALCEAAPELLDEAGVSIGLLKAQLDIGAAVNSLRRNQPDEAVSWYYSAWSFLHRKGYYGMGLDLLGRMADVFPGCSQESVAVTCELVREQGTPWVEGIEEEWHKAIAALVAAATVSLERKPNASGWFALCRLAKGPAYADQVMSNVVYDWRADPEAVALFGWIRELEQSVAIEPAARGEELFEYLLAATQVESRSDAGSTATERRDNLARRLDLHLRGRLTAGASAREDRFDLAALQARLPDDAVLVDLLFPFDAKSFGYCMLVSREALSLCTIQFEELAFRAVVYGDHVVSRVATTVVTVRRQVQAEPPEGSPVAASAQKVLAHAAREFLGHGVEWLAEAHAAGKRHLIVVPDGAMHFLPFHLLGEDRPFADDWIVTYLPSLDLLRRSSAPAGAEGAAVFGLQYQGTPDELPGAATEAAAVADALGVVMAGEAEATPARVLDALAEKRHVHIACHGEHDVIASALQSLRLTPGKEGDDGRLRTLDLVGRDLRGLSVLGLSACETGLGRVDAGGNPLGLGASALACGAASVVTTLWPVADDASATFFSTLFRGLASGQSRRDAFRAAQVATRAMFPEYRDWGAFCLSGDW